MQQVAAWTEYDRAGYSPRDVTIYNNGTAVVVMKDVAWWRWLGTADNVQAIDPDGGPYYGVGGSLRDWVITRIVQFNETEHTEGELEVTATFEVSKRAV